MLHISVLLQKLKLPTATLCFVEIYLIIVPDSIHVHLIHEEK